MSQGHRQRSKTSLTPITSSTTYSNPQHKAPLPPRRKHTIITKGSTITRRLVTKTGCYVLPQSQATQILTDTHQALHIQTKPLCHLLRPLMASPLDGHEFEQAPGVGDGQGSLVCCSPWGRKESDMTEQLN